MPSYVPGKAPVSSNPNGGPVPGAPSSPSSPGASAPGLPAPAPAAPSSPGASVGPPSLPRGPTAKSILRIVWDHPVYVPEKSVEGRTDVNVEGESLTAAQAFAFVSGKDPRPLLVLRQCSSCEEKFDPLRNNALDNEKTFLLSRWFHCVKLPRDVMQDGHPLRNLFPGGEAEHLFLTTRDGSKRVSLDWYGSRSKLWTGMLDVIAAEYTKKPGRSLKSIESSLDRLDVLDGRIAQLQSKCDRLIETDGPQARKLGKVRKQLGKARDERDDLLGGITKATDLGKGRSKIAVPAAAPAEPAGASTR